MTDPQTTSGQDGSSASNDFLPSGQEIYDIFMSQIEPDLVSNQLPLLEEHYANESEEETKKRLERYALAFEEYEKQYGTWMEKLQTTIETARTEACKKAEVKTRAEEQGKLADMEAMFSTPEPTPQPSPEFQQDQ